eukprot:13002705-Alexandrium_andersonii.AAC.1
MSASLVGSEMCIRDRLLPTRARLASPRVLRSRPSAPLNWRFWRRRLPVSYTHLTLPTICSV